MRAMMVAMEDRRSSKFPELTLSLFQQLKKVFKTETGTGRRSRTAQVSASIYSQPISANKLAKLPRPVRQFHVVGIPAGRRASGRLAKVSIPRQSGGFRM